MVCLIYVKELKALKALQNKTKKVFKANVNKTVLKLNISAIHQ